MSWNRYQIGDALDVLRELPDETFHCCVTSPPYWGLRQYLPDGVRLRDDLPDDVRDRVVKHLNELGIKPLDPTEGRP